MGCVAQLALWSIFYEGNVPEIFSGNFLGHFSEGRGNCPRSMQDYNSVRVAVNDYDLG